LQTFCLKFPWDASKYLITVIELNPFPLRSLYAHTIVRILEILLDNDQIDRDTKMHLVCILKKTDAKIYREVDEILDKLRKNDPSFNDI